MKRFVCFLLAIIMIVAMIPVTAIPAFAASERTTSDKAIDILKEYEGFAKNQYQSGGKYYIGYGSQIENGAYPNGITEADALKLLKADVYETVDVALNKFTAKNNLDLTQYQHDALALFSYNCGTAWLNQNGTLRNAVLQGKTGNEFINAMAQWHGGDVSNENFKGQINRRLSEANMYLNNSYGYNPPANFTYVILDLDGDKVAESTDKAIAFNSNSVQTLDRVPTAAESGCDPTSFLGWYVLDKATNTLSGEAVTKLDKNVAGATLVAKFYNGESFGNASYTLNTSSFVSRKVYNKTYTKAQFKTAIDEEAKPIELRANTNFAVDTEKMVEGIKWVRGVGTGTDGSRLEGWVYMGELPTGESTKKDPIVTATAKVALNIREGATKTSEVIDTLKQGETVDVYEIKVEKTETGNKSWGKIFRNGVGGWIDLAYTTINELNDENNSAAGRAGVIINTDAVNVREGAGVGYKQLTALEKGTKVTILKTEMNGAAQWGLVKWDGLKDGYTQGWVYMYYVEAEGLEHTGAEGTGKYIGIVNSTTNLNVRSFANIYAPRVGSLPTGTKVTVYEIENNNGMRWGRIGIDKWVCVTYLNLTEITNGGTAADGTTEIKGTVSVSSLSVLKNYNSNAAAVATLKKGEVVTILEKNTENTDTGSRIWGRIVTSAGVEGWINLAYVDLKTVTTIGPGTSSGSTSGTATAGVVANCLAVNVRTAAGVRNAQITKLNNGTAVVVHEQVTKDNAPWARITWNNGANEGWVCMTYITLGAPTTGNTTPEGGIVNGTSSTTISATGYVNNNILNVRAGAGLGYNQIGTLARNAKVTIFEQVVANGMIWGRINYNNATGWVCMSYITVESASSTGKGVMGTIARCFSQANVRSAPGTNNAIVSTVKVGSRVEVFEQRLHSNQYWGRIAQGWVCMDYVLLDTELPPGTILDATEATTAPTTDNSGETDETINRDGEIAFKVEAVTLQDLNVRNDASVSSDRVGTINAGMPVDIRAIKNNGAEVWGRIDQYATAGWINMDKANVEYVFVGYVNTDEQPIYVDANMAGTVKGYLPINTKLIITKVTTDGTNVYGWVEEGLFGWIPMSKISPEMIDVIKTYKSGETVGADAGLVLTGTTFAPMDAYDSIGGSKVLFKLTSGVTVKIAEVRFENGRIWAMVAGPFGEYAHAWIDLTKVNYSLSGIVNTTELNIRSSMDTSIDTNIVEVLPNGTNINVCQLAFDSYGNVWARLSNNSHLDDQVNGAFVMVMTATKTVYLQTAVLAS